jgi:hypothetical protein
MIYRAWSQIELFYWEGKREYGTNGMNGTDGKIINVQHFRLFRDFSLFRILSCSETNEDQ